MTANNNNNIVAHDSPRTDLDTANAMDASLTGTITPSMSNSTLVTPPPTSPTTAPASEGSAGTKSLTAKGDIPKWSRQFHVPPKHKPSSRPDPEQYRTSLCRHYVRGTACPFGRNCYFAHGPEQLLPVRTAEEIAASKRRALGPLELPPMPPKGPLIGAEVHAPGYCTCYEHNAPRHTVLKR